MRALLITVCSLLIALVTLAQAADPGRRFDTAEDADVRRVRWGMPVREVRNLEPGTPKLVQDALVIYGTTTNDQPCTISYLFREGKLCMVFYQFSDLFDDLLPYFDEVQRVRDELVARHGDPQIDRWDWEDPMFAEDPQLKGEALGLGLVRYELGWMTERSLVAVRMSGGSLKADIMVMYADASQFPAGQDRFDEVFTSVVGLPSPYFR